MSTVLFSLLAPKGLHKLAQGQPALAGHPGYKNASKFTLHDIRSLGILEITLGLMATHFIGFGLLFWAIGFGLLHIIYGIIMHVKYGS